MEVLDVLPAGLDVLVDDVWGDGADLDQPVVLDEDRFASQVAVGDGRRDRLVKITVGKEHENEYDFSRDLARTL